MKSFKLPWFLAVAVVALLAVRRVDAFPNYAPSAGTPNQAAVAQVLDTQFIGGPPGTLGALNFQLFLLPGPQIQQVLNQMTPQQYAAIFPGGSVPGASVQTNAVFDRLARLRSDREDAIAMDPIGAQKYGGVLLAEGLADTDTGLLADKSKKFGLWGGLTGDMGRQYGNPNGLGFSFSGEGATGGVDYRLADWAVVGFAGGIFDTHASVDQGLGTNDGQSFKYGGYASVAGGGFFADAYFGGGVDDFMVRRQLPALGLTAGASPTAHDFDMKIGGGFDAPAGPTVVTPFAWVSHDVMNVAGFSESGAGAVDATVSPFSVRSTKVALGFKLRGSAAGAFKPYFSTAWQHECEPSTTLTSQFSGGGSTFTTALAAPSPDAALVGIGFDARLARNITGRAGYNGEYRSGYINHNLNANLRLAF